jgi:hypothetical protein
MGEHAGTYDGVPRCELVCSHIKHAGSFTTVHCPFEKRCLVPRSVDLPELAGPEATATAALSHHRLLSMCTCPLRFERLQSCGQLLVPKTFTVIFGCDWLSFWM